MNINSSEYIKNNIQSTEAFKFFENSPKRKTSPENKPIVPKRPLRSSRLKSVIHVESFRDLLNSEYDITKENFDSSIHEIEPIKRRTRRLNTNSNKMSEILNRIDMHLDSKFKDKNLLDTLSDDKELNTQTTYDDLINSVDTDAIADMVNKYKRKEELGKCNSSKSRKTNKFSDQTLDNCVHNIDSEVNQTSLKASCNNVVNQLKSSDIPVKLKMGRETTRSLNNNSTNNENSVMNYFPVQDKQLQELSNASISPVHKVQESGTSERVLHNTSSNEYLIGSQNIEKSTVPGNIINLEKKHNSIQSNECSEEMNKPKSKKRGRPPKKTETITKSAQINNLQPKKRGRPPKKIELVKENKEISNSHVKATANPAKEPMARSRRKINKVTKRQMKTVNTKKIPKERLMDVLDIIDNDDHPIWEERNTSCNPYIYNHWAPRVSQISEQHAKLKYARQFLLRRDWISLSKILCYTNSTSILYYPLLSKYAALLLAHTDKDQFEKLIQLLIRASDAKSAMKMCTNIVKETDDYN